MGDGTMPKGKHIKPAVKKKVAELASTGMTMREIEKSVGISRSSVSNILNEEGIKDLVDTERKKFMSALPCARENIEHAIGEYKRTKNPMLKEHGFKASMRFLESAGMLSSNNTSITVQNVFNDQSTTVISPLVLDILKHSLKAEPIDVTPDE
jgi:predicted transcriptional regulator